MSQPPQSSHSRKGVLLLLAALLWTLFVLIFYYYVHKPIDPGLFLAILAMALDLALGLGIVILAGGIGRKISHFDSLSPLERSAVQAGLGALVFGLLFFFLGTAHLYYRLAFWLIFVAGIVFFRREMSGWLKDIATIREGWTTGSKLQRFVIVSILLFCGIQLIYSLALPVKWDALTYHLEIPRQYLNAHSLAFIPQNPYWGHPQTAEMISTFAMGMFRSQTAGVASWGFCMVFFAGMHGLASRFYNRFTSHEASREGAWITLAALLAGYTVRYLPGWAYSDLLAALLGLSALILFLHWLDEHQSQLFFWMVILASGAVTIKWTEGVLLTGILLCLPFIQKKAPVTWKLLFLSGAAALLVVSPWLVKNWLATGNPFFPFLFPTEGFSAIRLAAANPGYRGMELWSRILLPFSMTFMGVDTAAGFSADPGPMLLLLSLPGIFFLHRDLQSRLLVVILLPAAFAIGLFSYWWGHLLQPRLYYAVLPVAALPAGWGWIVMQAHTIHKIRLRNLLGAILITILLLCLVQDGHYLIKTNPSQSLLNISRSNNYLEAATGPYAEDVQTVEALDGNPKKIMLWEPRGLYCPLNSQPDLWIDRFQTDIGEGMTPETMISKWCREGFTNVLVYRLGEQLVQPLPGGNQYEWDSWQTLTNLLIDRQSINSLYNLYTIPCP